MTDEAILGYRLAEAERDIKRLESEIKQMRREAETRERARLRAGIGALGSAVLTLIGIIWAYRAVIFK